MSAADVIYAAILPIFPSWDRWNALPRYRSKLLSKIRLAVCILAGYVSAACIDLAHAAELPPTQITIAAPSDSTGKSVNRLILGTNLLAYPGEDPVYAKRGAGVWDPDRQNPDAAMAQMLRRIRPGAIRWPGGCVVHSFDWKTTIGSMSERDGQLAFGLLEFLKVAEDHGATPVITLSDFVGSADDMADLVEYLNTQPGRSRNGRRDWAALRQLHGRDLPYGVRYFEFGNETEHGYHKLNEPMLKGQPRYSATQYADKFRAIRRAMKAVDPSVQLGAVLGSDSTSALSHWTQEIIHELRDDADFYVYHLYLPRLGGDDTDPSAESLFENGIFAGTQFSYYVKQLNTFIQKESGRSVPVAVTEFNTFLVKNGPLPYRHTHGAAIVVADMLLEMLRPENQLAFANHWHFANEYWGAVSGFMPPFTIRPQGQVLEMMASNLEGHHVDIALDGPSLTSPGMFGVTRSGSKYRPFRLSNEVSLSGKSWQIKDRIGTKATQSRGDNSLEIEIQDWAFVNYYHAKLTVPITKGLGYRVTGQLRGSGFRTQRVQLEVGDARGWNATKSASLSAPVLGDGWEDVAVDYVPLPDAEAISIGPRRVGQLPEGGSIGLRNLRIREFLPEELPKISVVNSLLTRGRYEYALFLVNRSVRDTAPVFINMSRPDVSLAVTLTASDILATNEATPTLVAPKPLSVERTSAGIKVMLPKHSFSVIRFRSPFGGDSRTKFRNRSNE